MEKNVLGKGLSALIPEGHQTKEKIQSLGIESIIASKYQPRLYFSDPRLKDLSDSIKEKGIIQPMLVRPKNDKYEIIAGERRFRAAKLAGLTEVPVVVKHVSDEDLLELSLIENIQREELNRIEEAKAYQRLSREFGMTHERISKSVSKDRTTITNTLRLLELSQNIQDFVEQNTISVGHAKSLLSLDNAEDRTNMCQQVIKKSWSVRQTEQMVRNHLAGGVGAKKRNVKNKDIYIADIEDKLQHRLGTRVNVEQGKKRGKIIIEYYSPADLNRVLSLIHPDDTSG
ncbi:MAG: ParB family chromosome partitioning protein [Candidatus Omnitrophota bacterium]|jgi:ParB family chromosome partitioning protein